MTVLREELHLPIYNYIRGINNEMTAGCRASIVFVLFLSLAFKSFNNFQKKNTEYCKGLGRTSRRHAGHHHPVVVNWYVYNRYS
jgi:hypothetical protein